MTTTRTSRRGCASLLLAAHSSTPPDFRTSGVRHARPLSPLPDSGTPAVRTRRSLSLRYAVISEL